MNEDKPQVHNQGLMHGQNIGESQQITQHFYGTGDMPRHYTPPYRWPAWLLLLIILAIVLVPLAGAFAASPQLIAHHLILVAVLLFAYALVVCTLAIIVAFFRKIWERRGDSWADASANRLEYAIRAIFTPYKRYYAKFFFELHRDLDMKGITIRGAYTLELEQVFVDVRLDPIPPENASVDPLRLPSELQHGNPTIWDYLHLLDRPLVILGAPGSGKTTLLKHLGLVLVQVNIPRRNDGRHFPWRVPVLLTLRDYREEVCAHPEEYDLLQAIGRQLAMWCPIIEPTWMSRRLERGQCLMLLDGLDEIADPGDRQKMVAWVERQMRIYSNNRFVLTSRPIGYRANPLDGVDILEIQPFTLAKVKQFIHAWYTASEIKSAMRDSPGVRIRAQKGADDLLQRMQDNPALFALAVNPLLLTMIATVHLYHGILPGARVTLYKAVCEVFLRRRQQDPRSSQDLRAEQRQRVLQPLAYTMMQQKKREMFREEVCQIISVSLQEVNPALTPEKFLEQLETISSGLLLEREAGVFSFAHLTFQEYLAMTHLQEQHQEHELLSHLEDSWWHEVIRLYCAQADATPVLEACFPRLLSSFEVLSLALDCAEEALSVPPRIKERLYALLQEGVENPDPKQQRQIALALLRHRLEQMLPIENIACIDMSPITCAEYQVFLDAQHKRGHDFRPDHWTEARFAAGEGLSPVLGIRHSDAVAFCDWLTEQESSGSYHYRLPKRDELEQHAKKLRPGSRLRAVVVYWIGEDTHITWVGKEPSQLECMTRKQLDDAFKKDGEDRNNYCKTRPNNQLVQDSIALAITLNSIRATSNELTQLLKDGCTQILACRPELQAELKEAQQEAIALQDQIEKMHERDAYLHDRLQIIRRHILANQTDLKHIKQECANLYRRLVNARSSVENISTKFERAKIRFPLFPSGNREQSLQEQLQKEQQSLHEIEMQYQELEQKETSLANRIQEDEREKKNLQSQLSAIEDLEALQGQLEQVQQKAHLREADLDSLRSLENICNEALSFAHAYNFSDAFSSALTRNSVIDIDHILSIVKNNEFNSAMDQALANTSDFAFAYANCFAQSLTTYNTAPIRTSNDLIQMKINDIFVTLAHAQELASKLTSSHITSDIQNLAQTVLSTMVEYFSKEENRSVVRERPLIRWYIRYFARVLTHHLLYWWQESSSMRHLHLIKKSQQENEMGRQIIDTFLDIYVTFTMLEERIKGFPSCSPRESFFIVKEFEGQ